MPAAGHPTDLEEKILAGIAGEQLVATELGPAGWTAASARRSLP